MIEKWQRVLKLKPIYKNHRTIFNIAYNGLKRLLRDNFPVVDKWLIQIREELHGEVEADLLKNYNKAKGELDYLHTEEKITSEELQGLLYILKPVGKIVSMLIELERDA